VLSLKKNSSMLERMERKRRMAPATNSLIRPEKLAGPNPFDAPPHATIPATKRPSSETTLHPETPAPAPTESFHPPPPFPSQPSSNTPLLQPSSKADMQSSMAEGPPTPSVSFNNDAKDVSLASLVRSGDPNMSVQRLACYIKTSTAADFVMRSSSSALRLHGLRHYLT